MTREELLGLEGAEPYMADEVMIKYSLMASVYVKWENGQVYVEGPGGHHVVKVGRAATVADVERLVVALKSLGR